jgi:PhzF family phenazine biosynthesis protein
MKLPIYGVDTFTAERFHGNPAAVVIAPAPLDPPLMQAIATENNQPATAFVVPDGARYAIRWFTPTVELQLCGHGTFASAFALYQHGLETAEALEFSSASGMLRVSRLSDRLLLDFPARPATLTPDLIPTLASALGVIPTEAHSARATLAVLNSEAELRALRPDMAKVARIPTDGVIATAPGSRTDFVSRFFAPQLGIGEDSVTGSAHSTLIPYWSHRLGKVRLHALQLSQRGGELWCEDRGERVSMAGYCTLYLRGELNV